MSSYYLEPTNSQKSFYRKARVKINSIGEKTLYSYGTPVAEVYVSEGKKKAYVNRLYSRTTTRHIKSFLDMEGFDYKDSKDIMKRYGSML